MALIKLYRLATLHKRLYWGNKLQSVSKEKSLERNQVIALNGESTLDLLIERKLSFARFGEGELRLAFYQSPTIYEKINKNLALHLQQVLIEPHSNLLTGFNNYFLGSDPIRLVAEHVREGKQADKFESIIALNDTAVLNRSVMQSELKTYWNYITTKSSRTYFGEASVFSLSIYHEAYTKNQLQIVKNKIRAIFQSEHCLLISPENPQNGTPLAEKFLAPEWGITKITSFVVPKKDAFQDLKKILDYIEQNHMKFDLVVLQCGATATVLADLITRRFNLRAIDVGGFTN